jgi:hypothetical protein
MRLALSLGLAGLSLGCSVPEVEFNLDAGADSSDDGAKEGAVEAGQDGTGTYCGVSGIPPPVTCCPTTGVPCYGTCHAAACGACGQCPAGTVCCTTGANGVCQPGC